MIYVTVINRVPFEEEFHYHQNIMNANKGSKMNRGGQDTIRHTTTNSILLYMQM